MAKAKVDDRTFLEHAEKTLGDCLTDDPDWAIIYELLKRFRALIDKKDT